MPPTLLDRPRAARLLFLLGCAVLLTHAVTTTAAPAAKKKAKTATVRIAAPATGKANAAFGTVKLKKGARTPKVKVSSSPAGLAVTGAVSSKGKIAIAVARPAGGAGARAAAAGQVVVKITGRGVKKAKGVSVLSDALRTGAAPSGTCGTELAKLLGRPLRGISAGDAGALGRALAARVCGSSPAAADVGVLQRLGLTVDAPAGTPPGPAAPLPSGGITPPGPSAPDTGTPSDPPPGGGTDTGTTGACSNGKDDDGDGQRDFRGAGVANPDPGCASKTDTTENSEVAVSADCARNSGVFGGAGGPSTAAAAINDPCPQIEHVWMTIQPGVTDCVASSADGNYDCNAEHGLLHAKRTHGAPDNLIDFFTIDLVGAANCSVAPTLAIVHPDGTVYELVEPWPPSCGSGEPPEAECANGEDDDGDGQVDARQEAGADPDPGCTDGDDTSEDSEIAPPAGCEILQGYLGETRTDTAFQATGCGSLTGAWFRPGGGEPTECLYQLTGGATAPCDTGGALAIASFAASAQQLTLLAPVEQEPACNAPMTVALQRSDGVVIEDRTLWAC